MFPNGANTCVRESNYKTRSMIADIRAFCRILFVASLAILTIFLVPPAHAELSEEQKAQVRVLLPAPQLRFGFSFGFSIKGDFRLEINDRENHDYDRARLASLLKLPPPDDAEARLRYLRSVGDLHSELEQEGDAKRTYDEGEKLAISLVKDAPPRFRARFLALAGGFHADQEEYKEANALLKEALELAPDTWEVRYVESQLLWEQVFSTVKVEPTGTDLVQGVGDDKLPLESIKTASRFVDSAVKAINTAVALQEKTIPDPKNRSPKPYIARMLYRLQAEAYRKFFDAHKNGQAASFPKFFEHYLSDIDYDESAIRDMERAAACEPDNPYAVLAHRLVRALKSQDNEAFAKQFKLAQAGLAAIEKQTSIDPENRLRLLEAQAIIFFSQENWDGVAEKSLQGLALSPSRELFRVVHPVALMKQKQFAEAERFARDLLEKYDTPFNRMILARTQLLQGNFAGAERTLVALVETDKSNPTPALFLATVRLKATSSNSSKTKLREIRDFVEGLRKTYPGEFSDEEKLSSHLLIATYYALDGGEDIAKTMIQRVLDDDEDNAAVKSLLAVLP